MTVRMLYRHTFRFIFLTSVSGLYRDENKAGHGGGGEGGGFRWRQGSLTCYLYSRIGTVHVPV